MLMDLLAHLPDHPPVTGSVDRLFTGSYKSNGNLVSLKVDVIDFIDFQRHGCLSSPGPGGSEPHNHSITGTLYCDPGSNTVRLNITVLPCSNLKAWTPPVTDAVLAPKIDARSWPLHSPFGQSEDKSLLAKQVQYSQFSEPVSPPSEPYDVPPLLDFHSEQLMSEIQNMAFDLKDSVSLHNISLTSQSFSVQPDTNTIPLSVLTSPGLGPSNEDKRNGRVPGLSQSNVLVKSSEAMATSFASRQPPAKSTTASGNQQVSSLPPLPTLINNSPINNNIPPKPLLLQPKIERSESLCSDHNPITSEFLSFTDDMLDDFEDHNQSFAETSPISSACYSISSISSPLTTSSISSPKMFSPIKSTDFLYSPDKNGQFVPHQNNIKIKSEVFDMGGCDIFASSLPTISSSSSPSSSSPGSTYAISHSSISSPSQLVSTSPNPDPHPVTLLSVPSPKSRNRRNSSYDETKPHCCPQCGARFTTKSNLGQHAKIHLAVKPFICEICSHGFTRAAHYESHVAKHKGLKTHRCDQCGESFARLDNLLRHSARHKHGKIFDCETCGKGFHRKDKLLEHEKVHTNDFKFPCTMCAKTFHTNDALKHHVPLHEDVSKTQCKICLKFITIKSMSKHMSAFHRDVVNATNNENNNNINNNKSNKSRSRSNHLNSNDKNHGCNYCKKSFVSPAKLRLHVAKCHAQERLMSEQPPPEMSQNITLTGIDRGPLQLEIRGVPSQVRLSPGNQQVPEMDSISIHHSPEIHINSSPEEISEFGCSKDMTLSSGAYGIPTIHIPEFELQSKLEDNHDITTEAIQALLFS